MFLSSFIWSNPRRTRSEKWVGGLRPLLSSFSEMVGIAPAGEVRGWCYGSAFMGTAIVRLNDMGWTNGAHPLERKKTEAGVTLLEFAPGFADPNWCINGHVIYMLAGRLELELDGETLMVNSGEACVVDAGTRHRAINPDPEPARLLVFSPQLAG